MPKYYYFGNSHQPYELKECLACFSLTYIVKNSNYCSISCSKRNQPMTKLVRRFTGTRNEYKRYHARVNREHGSANKCVLGCTKGPFAWANYSGNYADPNDYIQLCRSCHSRYDYRSLPLYDVIYNG